MRSDQKADWFVEAVMPRRDYTLVIDFASGERRIYDARELLADRLFAPLKSIDFFMKAHRAGHSVVWNDDVDISPEYLYEKSSKDVASFTLRPTSTDSTIDARHSFS